MGELTGQAFGRGVFERGGVLGVAVAMVELGYLYAYRRGLPITVGPVSMLATVALIPIGIIMSDEHVSWRTFDGVRLSVGRSLVSSVVTSVTGGVLVSLGVPFEDEDER